MTIKPGYIGWPNGLSLGWGAQSVAGRMFYVSLAWRDTVAGFYIGRIDRP